MRNCVCLCSSEANVQIILLTQCFLSGVQYVEFMLRCPAVTQAFGPVSDSPFCSQLGHLSSWNADFRMCISDKFILSLQA